MTAELTKALAVGVLNDGTAHWAKYYGTQVRSLGEDLVPLIQYEVNLVLARYQEMKKEGRTTSIQDIENRHLRQHYLPPPPPPIINPAAGLSIPMIPQQQQLQQQQLLGQRQLQDPTTSTSYPVTSTPTTTSPAVPTTASDRANVSVSSSLLLEQLGCQPRTPATPSDKPTLHTPKVTKHL